MRTLTALLLLCVGVNSSAAEKFNLVSIVTDDQARWALGCYGNAECRTPNMDRIAREGAKFLNAFTCTPVCSPSRAAFMTGRYGTQLGITDWIAPNEAQAGVGLPPGTLTWPKVLQDAGYKTALVGKWHLGTKPQMHPTKNGFDHFFGHLQGGWSPLNPTLEENGNDKQFQGASADILGDDALKFIDANKDKPFTLLLHFREPHTPYTPMPKQDTDLFKDIDPTVPTPKGVDVAQVKQWTREYYAAIHAADRNIGRVLKQLDDLKLTEKTIVMFTSDHGYMIGHHSLHTKGNAWWIAGGVQGPKRPNMFDDSLRIPLLVRWPGVVKPGTEIKETISNFDTYATVRDMLLGPMPQVPIVNGRSFAPLLRGETVEWDNTLFGQYDLHNGGLAYMRMIRTSEWKLIRHHHANQMDELYDLKNDPGETKNVYGQAAHRDVREKLQQRLTAWMRSVDDPLAAPGAATTPP